MIVALLYAALFFLGAAYNLFSPKGTLTNGAIAAALSGLLTGAYFFERHGKAERKRFLAWLAENHPRVSREGALYGSRRISPDTRLTHFTATLSFVVFCFKVPTRFYFDDEEMTYGPRLVCLLVSLFFGWWSLPWGPAYTLESLFLSLSGGRQTDVRSLVDRMMGGAEADPLED